MAKVEELFAERGESRYDHFSTQAEHARVTAHMAQQAGAGPDLVVAAFLHDVGHLLLNEHAGREDFLADDKVHEEIGARFLRRAFPERIAEVVRLHVDAKRYLCAVDSEYHAGLSKASQLSLELQGGALAPEDASRWAAQPFAAEAAQLRKLEDEGKRLWAAGQLKDGDLPSVQELMSQTRQLAVGL